MLDIIGGLMIGGIMMIIGLTASDIAIQSFYNYNSDAIFQENLRQVTVILEYDLRKMGFGIPESQLTTIIETALPQHLKFIANLNKGADNYVKLPGTSGFDDIPDTVEYVVSLADTINFPDTTISIYQINRTLKIGGGNTYSGVIGRIGNSDVFTYLDQAGQPAPLPMSIRMVEVTLTAFNPEVVLSPENVKTDLNNIQDSEFRKQELKRLLRTTYWRQTRMVSKNLYR